MSINLMRKVILAENILGVYRNIYTVSGIRRKLALLRVIVELTFMSYFYIERLFDDSLFEISSTDDKIQSSTYIAMLLLNTYYVMIAAIINGKHYGDILGFITRTEKHLKTEFGYKNTIKRLKIMIATYVFGWVMISILGAVPFLVVLFDGMSLTLKITYFFLGIVSEGRLLLEDIMNSCFLLFLSGCLECLSNSVQSLDLKIKLALKEESKDVNERRNVFGIKYLNLLLKHKAKCWIKDYETVNMGSVLAKKVFGTQIFLSVSFAVSYLTVMMYRYATRYLTNVDFDWSDWSLILLFVHALGIITIAITGQRVHSEALRLRRCVARLNLTLLSVPETPREVVKMVSHLLRAVSTDPVAIDCIFSLRVGMPLLPQFFSFAIEWVVVGLQGNHVI